MIRAGADTAVHKERRKAFESIGSSRTADSCWPRLAPWPLVRIMVEQFIKLHLAGKLTARAGRHGPVVCHRVGVSERPLSRLRGGYDHMRLEYPVARSYLGRGVLTIYGSTTEIVIIGRGGVLGAASPPASANHMRVLARSASSPCPAALRYFIGESVDHGRSASSAVKSWRVRPTRSRSAGAVTPTPGSPWRCARRAPAERRGRPDQQDDDDHRQRLGGYSPPRSGPACRR